jgi:rhodanese-related sulfurtransferase
MKIKLIMSIIIGLVVVIGLIACNNESSSKDSKEKNQDPVYQSISAEEAKEMMDGDAIVLDVRTQEEYDQGHIEGALLLPLSDIQMGELSLLEDKDQVILVYCRSGNRSETAARLLIDEGYRQVYDFGGIIDWPYEIVK